MDDSDSDRSTSSSSHSTNSSGGDGEYDITHCHRRPFHDEDDLVVAPTTPSTRVTNKSSLKIPT